MPLSFPRAPLGSRLKFPSNAVVFTCVRRGSASAIKLKSTQLPLGDPRLAVWLYTAIDVNADRSFIELRLREESERNWSVNYEYMSTS